MGLNQAITATTQVGVATAGDEGYATQLALATALANQFPANSIPASAVQGIAGADDDVDTVTFTVAAGGNLTVAVSEGGTTVTGSMNVTALATALASSPTAMVSLAGALRSADANNSLKLGSDNLLYENDAT